MQNKYSQTLLFLLSFCILMQATSLAQADTAGKAYKKEKAVVIYAGGGFSFFTGEVGTPAGFNAAVEKTHFIGTLRVMWHPGHLMHVGLETGSVRFYSYTIDNNGKKGTTAVNATPLLFVLSMPLSERVHVFAGTGNYFMRSTLDYEGSVESNSRSLGWMLAAAYQKPISKNFGIAAEAKWMNATGTKDALLGLQLQLLWKLK
jgi:hypothetical protein